MVLAITNRCQMQCPHCLNDCESEGHDITLETLDRIIEFINHPELRFRVILVGGGEPSEHPQLFEILDRLYETNNPNKWGEKKAFVLATNAMFLNADEVEGEYRKAKDFSDRLLGYKDLMIQISADPRFYKTKINERNLKYLQKKGRNMVKVERNISLLGRYGRALQNAMPAMDIRSSPFCFNTRSVTTHGYSFPKTVEFLEAVKHKFCAISFDMHGNIRISESLTCMPIGTVDSTHKELEAFIRNMKCHKCSPFANLSPTHKKAIGL